MQPLYLSQHTKPIDQAAEAFLQIDSYQLMQRAALSVYRHVVHHDSLLVVTGPGNNGGDGWVLAELARRDHKQVRVWVLQEPDDLKGDAARAAADYQGEMLFSSPKDIDKYDVVIDAIFGTGLSRPPEAAFAEAVQWINNCPGQVVAVDIPSGLNGDTGVAYSPTVNAELTVAVLNLMPGHFTADGRDYCGQVIWEDLDVPERSYKDIKPAAYLLKRSLLFALNQNRKHNSHKGSFGRLLVAGGQHGMLGAVILSGTAALATGAGLVQIITTEEQAPWIPLNRPELMALGFAGGEATINIPPADVLVLGMGLGTSQWSKALWEHMLNADISTVLDADGLNLLADQASDENIKSIAVITPHPKEAARLLDCSVKEVQSNRLSVCNTLANKFRCVAVLKGSGTVISDGNEAFICPYGSADLATAGTGDVLAGLIGSLMSQGYSPLQSAQIAVVWHAKSADDAQLGRCLTATDLIQQLQKTLSSTLISKQ